MTAPVAPDAPVVASDALAIDVTVPVLTAEFLAFWEEYHLCTLTTLRPNGTPHVVPVGATYDPVTGIARVITGVGSRKARNVAAAGEAGARVALCQVDGGRWATLEGLAVVRQDAESVADAVARYARRYRTPRPNPERVVIEIKVTRVLGRGTRPGQA
ncbi:pyridoxamine 5'-phosphate oxidase family protein [Kitasatospora kifunensis]|uniref:PPOX class probable F420-dependent enzyme n=1 Tax=Kitasatospora kifunensis TaxID=58351 RepID=A0A7W7VYW1_KITKI|nr:TIGR03618 family F420-dependent PPOX class oxidoreductase [Kitasatospora kifunensis]MBB4927104.1 PPOX class probable F420-dependent enzyme [Kitasatospora kifunensis]